MWYNNYMKCVNCNSSRFMLYNMGCTVRLELINDVLYFSNPFDNKLEYNSGKNFACICSECKNCEYINLDNFNEIHNREIKFDEITLDLDHTLIHAESEDFISNEYIPDFEFDIDNHFYGVFFRPYLKEFIAYLNDNFKKINIYTAASEIYAENIIEKLNIKNLGFVKTRSDCIYDRSFLFEREYLKFIDNNIIIDDKLHVINGTELSIIQAPLFHYTKVDDKFLLETINNFKNYKPKKVLIKRDFELNLNFQCRGFTLSKENVNIDVLNYIIKLKMNEEEYDSTLIRFGRKSYDEKKECYYFRYSIKNDKASINIFNITYKSYKDICLKLNEKPISKNKWDKLYKKEQKDHKLCEF